MSTGEVLMILLVALLVFGPSKLPLLAHHLGRLFVCIESYKQKAQNLLNEHQLNARIEKALEIDVFYKELNIPSADKNGKTQMAKEK